MDVLRPSFGVSIRSAYLVLVGISFIILPVAFPFADGKELHITLIHTNDVHSRFMETNKYGGPCSEKEKDTNACYGGFPRLHYMAKQIRENYRNVIYLSGGDYFQGTVWYTLNKWRVVSHFVNILNHTAMALGNHEFDDNIGGLVPFLDAATFPVISANIDTTNEPPITGKFTKSVVVEYEGTKVGIIGYTTVETPDISVPGNLIFEDEVKGVGMEAERLHNAGIQILFAVGHAGYDVDLKIATVPYIDVVVGGHTNTFLYTGNPPSSEEAIGKYPTMVTQASGKQVPVVQAYAYGKYLGFLNLTFDENGEVVRASGNPILLDANVPQDEEILKDLEVWNQNVSVQTKQEVGKTHVFLDGRAVECRLRECNLGNLIADAMVFATMKFEPEVSMSLLNSGGIRSSIDLSSGNGSITMEDILTILPFRNTIDIIEIQGKWIREAFEFSVSGYDPTGYHLPGKFLQVSGIRVVYDISQPDGHKVSELSVLCNAYSSASCKVPHYVPLDENQKYKVAIQTYTATGGDGYKVIKENLIQHHIPGILDTDMLIEYIVSRNPVTQGLDGRISFGGVPCPDKNHGMNSHSQNKIWPLYLTLSSFIILASLIQL